MSMYPTPSLLEVLIKYSAQVIVEHVKDKIKATDK